MTAEAAEQLVGDLVMVVSDLEDEAEQSEDNLDIIANVFEDIDNLVESGELNVTEEVSSSRDKHYHLNLAPLLFSSLKTQ